MMGILSHDVQSLSAIYMLKRNRYQKGQGRELFRGARAQQGPQNMHLNCWSRVEAQYNLFPPHKWASAMLVCFLKLFQLPQTASQLPHKNMCHSKRLRSAYMEYEHVNEYMSTCLIPWCVCVWVIQENLSYAAVF